MQLPSSSSFSCPGCLAEGLVHQIPQVKTTEQQVLAEAEKTTEKYGLEAGLYQVGVML